MHTQLAPAVLLSFEFPFKFLFILGFHLSPCGRVSAPVVHTQRTTNSPSSQIVTKKDRSPEAFAITYSHGHASPEEGLSLLGNPSPVFVLRIVAPPWLPST
jgi:hypothetical protein